MSAAPDPIRAAVSERDLPRLFVSHLGWDRHASRVVASVDEREYQLDAVAHKRGVVVFECVTEPMPRQAVRREIEARVAREVREHLIVFTAEGDGSQVWQWVKREIGQPAVCRERVIHAGQDGASVADAVRGLEIALDDEAELTFTDVLDRLRARFDADRPTRKFFDRFQAEHGSFLGQIQGIEDPDAREWYASVMLNRLMFVYFLQKKRFLDGDDNYLQNRMAAVKKRAGDNRFLSFYRSFLMRLFHQGLGASLDSRTQELSELIGDVPYLNGGLFTEHELEERYEDIEIPDEAFTAIFSFFDAFTWTIDDRPVASSSEINPDVLGYIFERFVNRKERKDKGAYYTQEDVTGYMTANSVIPAVFDAVLDRADRFEALRHLLSEQPRRYLHPAAAYGLDDFTALDGESPRAAAGRLKWSTKVVGRLEAGDVDGFDDLITLNLDLRQLAQDYVERIDDPEIVAEVWRSLNGLRVLDPTCGSGAFLFAALRVLEPLYEAVLTRMRGWLEEPGLPTTLRREFELGARPVEGRRREAYWIAKQIVAGNLYGVDLLEEAAEICKLRLYLRIVSCIDRKEDLEPLPDIDFNIRTGNALVGFGTEDQALNMVGAGEQASLDIRQRLTETHEMAQQAADAFRDFRAAQQHDPADDSLVKNEKQRLNGALEELRAELDALIVPDHLIDSMETWRRQHRPFHWWAEFYDVMHDGGFDVVIGNPPYVARAKIEYAIEGFDTEGAPDIYANIMERSLDVLRSDGRLAMIVMLSLAYSTRFRTTRTAVLARLSAGWFSHFGRIPDYLFSDDVRVRNTIVLGKRGAGTDEVYTTQLHRWLSAYRPYLFEALRYARTHPRAYDGLIPKLGTPRLGEALERSRARHGTLALDLGKSTAGLFFKTNAYNWLAFSFEEPPCYDQEGRAVAQSKVKRISFTDEPTRDAAFLLLNGKLMFTWWRVIGGDLDLTNWMIETFPYSVARLSDKHRTELEPLVGELAERMPNIMKCKVNAGKEVYSYDLSQARDITDRSDQIFAAAMGLGDAWEDIELTYAETVKSAAEVQ